MIPNGETSKVEEEALKSNATALPSKANPKAYVESYIHLLLDSQ